MRQASSLPACAVCHESLGKYKCPCCRLPYCGVACYKQHKASPCAAPPVAALPPQPPREFEADEADEEGLRLKQADLQRLASDPGVALALRDAELRRVVRLVDRAEDGEAALVAALREPRFHAFADQVLNALHTPS